MKKLLVSIGLMMSLLVVNIVPVSATDGEQIRSFETNVLVKRTNTVVVSETIVYDFYTSSHHGIYRDIPIDYHDGKDNYYLDFKLIEVLDEFNQSLETKLTTENGNKRIRIGNPDATVTGIHTYRIDYELSPLITQHDQKPFLNLDVVGEGWNVPIYNIKAKVTLEDDQPLTNITWYGGSNLSNVQSEFATYSVDPYNGVTINANLPDGYVTNYLQPNKPRFEDILESIWNVAIAVLITASCVGAVTIVLARTIRTRMRRKKQIVVAQYEPPKDLSPAHIGLLQDDVAAGREITATVIDWAVRGYIKITYIPKKGLFGSKDYQLNVLKQPDDLPTIERVLFDSFFSSEEEINLSGLNKTAVSAQVIIFKATLKKQLTDKGYYDKEGNLLMRGTLTEEGAKQWALVDGFKLYLSVVEKDRLKFSDAPERTPERFNKLLPYAIALGVEKEWAKQFEGIDLTQSTTWYSGNLAAFSAVALTSDLSSSFAPTVSSNSSVSSGGGSSGGGFGGGGGGSW